MDVKKYIESGILELYVLGKLSDQERKAVEENVAAIPELKTELNQIEQSLEEFALLHQIQPSSGILDNIKTKIQQEAPPNPSTLTIKKTSSNWLVWLLGLICLGLALLAYFMWNSNLQKQQENEQVQNDLVACQTEKDQIQSQYNIVQRQLDIIRRQGNQTVLMLGTDKSPDATASVYWNPTSKETYLDPFNLPSPSTGKQYQLWAILPSGPTDMGVFDLPTEPNSLIEVPYFENVQAFAITEEDTGGKAVPTLTDLVVIGNVTS